LQSWRTPVEGIEGPTRTGVFNPRRSIQYGCNHRQNQQGGANHVVIQVLGGPDKLLPTLAELAGPLGLSR
jgi:hypothetical protein